ncbi:hypothetical protein C8Q76DRAFT_799885 [Earliella scabrosa]|nr:hypothetical protein C8Q76DRAFT_799885 [Earliella scabrosa]
MSSSLLLDFPIYVQLPERPPSEAKRHVLTTVRLWSVNPDEVSVETDSLSTLPPYCRVPERTAKPSHPRRKGVRVYYPNDLLNMPIYILIKRRNRLGDTYRLLVILKINEDEEGTITVSTTVRIIKRRHEFRSMNVRVSSPSEGEEEAASNHGSERQESVAY